jgi:CubicO group peptidase (beta-lactamase class C family)
VVAGDQVIHARGYGFADLETRTPVQAARTLFYLGSAGKLFTWTAVMQLVAAGKIDLDVDVMRYLDFPIPPTQARYPVKDSCSFDRDSYSLIRLHGDVMSASTSP